jgi:hypothetical protein
MPGYLRLTGRFQMSEQDAENVRQRRSRIVQTLNVPQRVRLGPSRKIAFGCPARQGGEEKGLLPEAAPIF